jgi:hypothetical protein
MLKKHLTIKDLEDLGITSMGSQIRPHLFRIQLSGIFDLGQEIHLYEPYTLEQVFKRIFGLGSEVGEARGREQLQTRLKALLNIE